MLWTVIGAIAAIWLLLLAQSAWRQGELMLFLRALLIVTVMGGVLVAFVAGWIWLDR